VKRKENRQAKQTTLTARRNKLVLKRIKINALHRALMFLHRPKSCRFRVATQATGNNEKHIRKRRQEQM
jgi:hypothetical protein